MASSSLIFLKIWSCITSIYGRWSNVEITNNKYSPFLTKECLPPFLQQPLPHQPFFYTSMFLNPNYKLQPIYFFMKMVDQAHLHHMQKYHKNVFITCNILKNVSLNWILSVSSESARGPYTLKRTIACSKCKILNRTHKD